MNIKLNPERIHGNWRAGWTLDLDTVSSQQRLDGGFDNVRTELGELLYTESLVEPQLLSHSFDSAIKLKYKSSYPSSTKAVQPNITDFNINRV